MTTTYLGQKGYTIMKKSLSIQQQEEIRSNLTATHLFLKHL